MTFSLSAAIKVVEAHKDELDLQPNLHKEYIDNLKEIEKRTNEDYRQANAIAVDAGKTIFALATAAFVAVGAFVQHGLSQGSMLFDRPIIALGLASVALIYCVFEGVIVISLAYRRGSGVQEFKEWKIYHHWSVQPLRRHLFRQFAAGALGCFLLASAVILYGVSPRPAVMTTAEGLRMGLTEMGRGLESLTDELRALRTERSGALGKLDELELTLESEVEGLRKDIASARQEQIKAMELVKAIVALDSNFPPIPFVKPTGEEALD